MQIRTIARGCTRLRHPDHAAAYWQGGGNASHCGRHGPAERHDSRKAPRRLCAQHEQCRGDAPIVADTEHSQSVGRIRGNLTRYGATEWANGASLSASERGVAVQPRHRAPAGDVLPAPGGRVKCAITTACSTDEYARESDSKTCFANCEKYCAQSHVFALIRAPPRPEER